MGSENLSKPDIAAAIAELPGGEVWPFAPKVKSQGWPAIAKSGSQENGPGAVSPRPTYLPLPATLRMRESRLCGGVGTVIGRVRGEKGLRRPEQRICRRGTTLDSIVFIRPAMPRRTWQMPLAGIDLYQDIPFIELG
jgi:hypothetical protein